MNIKPFIDAFRRCFPEIEAPDLVAQLHIFILMGSESLDSSNPFMSVGSPEDERRRLSAITHHLNAALTAYHQLHPLVRDSLDHQFEANSKGADSYRLVWLHVDGNPETSHRVSLRGALNEVLQRLTGKFTLPDSPPRGEGLMNGIRTWTEVSSGLKDADGNPEAEAISKPLAIVNQLIEEIAGSLPRLELRELPSAIDIAAERANTLVPESGKARSQLTWQKVVIVNWTIDCWKQFRGAEPDLTSASFQDLLQGLSDTLDPIGERNWDAGDLVRSYRRSVRKVQQQNHK